MTKREPCAVLVKTLPCDRMCNANPDRSHFLALTDASVADENEFKFRDLVALQISNNNKIE
jgi:hypothetical protein